MNTDDLRAMARSPQHYSNYTLAGALHQVLDHLEQAEREVDRLGDALHRAMWTLYHIDPEAAAKLDLDLLADHPLEQAAAVADDTEARDEG